MKKNILILSTSPRKNGNSEMLAREFARGAEEAGHNVELLSLHDKTLGFCKGCLACQKTQRCVIHDDADAIVRKMKDAEVIAFATPIYFYEMCGQMKTLLDRSNPLFPSDYAFRDIYLLATAADSAESSMDGAVKGLEGWIACFEKAVQKQTWKNPNPYQGACFFHLGLALEADGQHRKAYDAFYKSTWSAETQSAGFYWLACLEARRGNLEQALEFVGLSLVRNWHNMNGRCLKAALLVFEALFGGDNQDRHRKSTRPQVINQFISVHSGHHNIRNNEIYIFRI